MIDMYEKKTTSTSATTATLQHTNIEWKIRCKKRHQNTQH